MTSLTLLDQPQVSRLRYAHIVTFILISHLSFSQESIDYRPFYETDWSKWILGLMVETHHSERKDGNEPWYAVKKLSLVPTLALRGSRSVWTRPQIRLVYLVARFNDAAKEAQYSPYLDLVGKETLAHYLGVKAEWWTW